MTHADDFIRYVHTELGSRYPMIPRLLELEDEPAGDFALAHFWGLRADGTARLSFDEGYAPKPGIVAHELCHAGHANAGGDPFGMSVDDQVLAGYWRAMGYATPLVEAIAKATETGAWAYYPGEQMADAFAWLIFGGDGWGGAQPWLYGGAYTPESLARIDAFFQALRPVSREVTSVIITDEDMVRIDERTKHHIGEYAQRLQTLQLGPLGLRVDELERRVINAGEVLSAGRDIPGTP